MSSTEFFAKRRKTEALRGKTMKMINGNNRRFAARVQYALVTIAILSTYAPSVQAQEHTHVSKQEAAKTTAAQTDANALVKIVRDATEKFKDVAAAQAAGYALQFGCVSGDADGAMGLHYVNGALVNSGIIDATKPQIVIYE